MDDYYVNQAGSGIGGFQGTRYQKGHGFLGRIAKGAFLPILKKVLPFLGQTALQAGSDILSDYTRGESLAESSIKHLNSSKRRVEEATMGKVRLLTGGGRKKKTKSICKRRNCYKRGSSVKPTKSRSRKVKSKKKRSTNSKKTSAKDFL